jgi:hypothetical protein
MPLADLQRALAAGLTGRGPGPEGMDPEALERARRALESKRRRAAAHLLPRLRAALGSQWRERFADHAARYVPAGLLYHVDDAWEFGQIAARGPERAAAAAARDDLAMMRLRWARRSQGGIDRIQERRGMVIARVRSPVRMVLIRMPGREGRVWGWRV